MYTNPDSSMQSSKMHETTFILSVNAALVTSLWGMRHFVPHASAVTSVANELIEATHVVVMSMCTENLQRL